MIMMQFAPKVVESAGIFVAVVDAWYECCIGGCDLQYIVIQWCSGVVCVCSVVMLILDLLSWSVICVVIVRLSGWICVVNGEAVLIRCCTVLLIVDFYCIV